MAHLSEKQLLALAVSFEFGRVARDLGSPDDRAARVADRGEGERNVDETAVLALPHRLEALDPLALSDALQDFRLLGQPVGRNDNRDVFADRLLGRKPEEP